MNERRKGGRRPLNFEVTCYIDGARLEAQALDISAGGVFVGSDMSRPVPVGSLAGLVFVSETNGMGTTFLFGRVVRKQDFPVTGFAVEWEKAVSAGGRDELQEFLKSLVGIEEASIEEECVGSGPSGGGLTRCVFRFPVRSMPLPGLQVDPEPSGAGFAAGSEPSTFSFIHEDESFVDIPVIQEWPSESESNPAEQELRDEPVVEYETPGWSAQKPEPSADADPVGGSRPFDDLQTCFGTLNVSDEEVSSVKIGPRGPDSAHVSAPGVLGEIRPVSPRRAGTLTAVVEKGDSLVVCSLNGIVSVSGISIPVVVTGLGLTAAVVKSSFIPAGVVERVDLSFVIGTKRGESTVRCACRLAGTDRDGFRVAFAKLDEGTAPGILRRYLKWLHFNEVAQV